MLLLRASTLKLSLPPGLILAVSVLYELILQFWESSPVFFINGEGVVIVFSVLRILIC